MSIHDISNDRIFLNHSKDCNIVVFHCRLFPSVNIITEMYESANMRFMHFQAFDEYTEQISQLEKVRAVIIMLILTLDIYCTLL
jgi:hypothetical protein